MSFMKARHIDFPHSVWKAHRKETSWVNMANEANTLLNFARSLLGRLTYHMLLFYTLPLQIRVILCHLIVWKVVLTHLWAGQLYLVRANIGSWAKYWSSVQNIDSHQLVEWGDEGSFEGTMTQLEGNPKNPDPPQFIILPAPCCSMVASLGAQCNTIHWMEHILLWISVFLKEAQICSSVGTYNGHARQSLLCPTDLPPPPL